jgi:hypothetical protein
MGIADDLRQGHLELLEFIEGLTAEELNRPDTIGKWSARDVILHLAMWDGEALKALAVWRTGHEYDWAYAKDYLKFNEFWIGNFRHLGSSQVIQMFNLVRNALIADSSAVSEDIWSRRGGVPRWIYDVVIDHTKHHLERLRAYRKSLGK